MRRFKLCSDALRAVNELEPIQARLAQVNEWLGDEVIRFRPFELPAKN